MGEVRSVWNSPSTIYSVHHWSESPRCGDYTYKCQALKLQHKNWSEGSYNSTSYCIVTCTFFFWRVNIFVKLLLNKSNLPAKYCKLYKSQRRSHEKENKNKMESTNLVWTSSTPLILFMTQDMPAFTPVITAKLRACTKGPPVRACIIENAMIFKHNYNLYQNKCLWHKQENLGMQLKI